MASTPWTIKGIDDADRAKIIAMARRHGVPIGNLVAACCLRADGEPITVTMPPPAPAPVPDGANGGTPDTERLERLIRLAGDAAAGTPAYRTAMRALSRLLRAELRAVLPPAQSAPGLPRLPAPEPSE